MRKTEIAITLKDNSLHTYLVEHNMSTEFCMSIENAVENYVARNNGFDINQFISYVGEKGFKIRILNKGYGFISEVKTEENFNKVIEWIKN